MNTPISIAQARRILKNAKCYSAVADTGGDVYLVLDECRVATVLTGMVEVIQRQQGTIEEMARRQAAESAAQGGPVAANDVPDENEENVE